jgi:hypothetical protein
VLGYLFNFAVRGAATLLAMIQDHDVRGHWHKLLALPLAGPFHFVFNIATTTVGLLKDVFGFGVNTHFAPETTLAASGVRRISEVEAAQRQIVEAATRLAAEGQINMPPRGEG